MNHRPLTRTHTWALPALLLILVLGGCASSWEATVIGPDGSEFAVNPDLLEEMAIYAEDEDEGTVPLDRILWTAGHVVIDRLVITDAENAVHEFAWPEVADDAWWQDNGKVRIGDKTLSASRLEASPPALLARNQAYITDIAATVAAALDLPAPQESVGQALETGPASHVLLLFLDGFGYLRYTEARDAGLIPNLSSLDEPLVGLTYYVPSTRVGTAALLTGAPPEITGVDGRKVRKTEVETIFDVALEAGLHVIAVEGEALAFNLRNAETQLSGDRDGNGSTDDNVLANALDVLDAGMPDLFYVHFHGIDDAGHTYGPLQPEEEATIQEVDAAVGQLLAALPEDTRIVIFADHGMHHVEEEGRLGNHGHLIERDMFIPIWLVEK